MAAACAAGAMLFAAPSADAQITSALGINCVAQPASGDVRFCQGTSAGVPTWDGTTPIDVNVALPPAPAAGADGPYPLVMIFHGWGGSKLGLGAMRSWAEDGYAVFSMSDRGWGNSCGGTDPKRLTPACAQGYNHLMDTRHEVRDAQHFAGRLVDEDIALPTKIGATGGSYGGGLSMALAALKNRVMMPDGSLVPWTSPDGASMEIAAAQPDIPWTDLAYSLLPNGHTLDYVADSPYSKRGRIGISKTSFVAALYGVGQLLSNFSVTDQDAAVPLWFALINAGEPYDVNPLAGDIVDEVTTHHSSYYIDDSVEPAPLLISNGWTDDLFPPDEAIRFYNRTRTEHPGADISLFFSDHGHMRGQNKAADSAIRSARTKSWFDYYLKGQGPAPALGVETLTQTCPGTDPSGGPFTAPSWKAIAPGEVRLTEAAPKSVLPVGGDPTAGQAYDPIAGGGACATAGGADAPGAASYRLPAAPAGGYTLMGSPTVVADINSPGPNSQVAARLVDVAPSGDATLVARGLYRPEINVGTSPTRQVFQLHPNGYKFEAGHVAKLELIPNDTPYGRLSNGQLPVTVSNLALRLPVLEAPGDLGGGFMSNAPAPKVVPSGYELAADYLTGPPGDEDGDGVTGPADQCPAAPGPASNNGCPAIGADDDTDGIPDSQDRCPAQTGEASNGGCPATVTNKAVPPGGKKCKKRKKKAKGKAKGKAAAKKKAKKRCGKKRKRKKKR